MLKTICLVGITLIMSGCLSCKDEIPPEYRDNGNALDLARYIYDYKDKHGHFPRDINELCKSIDTCKVYIDKIPEGELYKEDMNFLSITNPWGFKYEINSTSDGKLIIISKQGGKGEKYILYLYPPIIYNYEVYLRIGKGSNISEITQ